ncbi:thioesterase II family protein [Nocardia sp. CDC160]|uniref:thioesterase II family protein n=1 Tax=Nocardia sp. CDC160 TaxID=3112166 RepID=UPI002DB710BE|nr:alpha/beta fold hydrolase [Nocardia sp. CDC160]MEC3917831.1 alpha/beta fold hydrolase [Nocardia sp. CDC160]
MVVVGEMNQRWIRRFSPAPEAGVRLACLAHAGGSASYFLPVARALAPGCEVLAVQYPGRQDRRLEKAFESVGELADAVAEQLLAWTDRPLVIFGHSLGALVGFEVAGRLADKGCEPAALVVSGRRAPSRVRVENVHTRTDDGILAELNALGGTDPLALADPEMRQLILDALRADYTAVETYRYTERAPLRVPISAHIGTDDPRVTLDEAQDWARHTTGGFELHTYPGGHFYLNDQAATVIANLRRVLAAAQTGS